MISCNFLKSYKNSTRILMYKYKLLIGKGGEGPGKIRRILNGSHFYLEHFFSMCRGVQGSWSDTHPGLEKMFISLQAWQYFPPTGHISLTYFFIFPSRSQNFPAMSFTSCLFFPALHPSLAQNLPTNMC